MAKAKKQEEPSLRDQLLADYDRMEKSIEEASQTELWELADWLAEYVPEMSAGRPSRNREPEFAIITIEDLAAEGHRTKRWLQMLRKVSKDTEADRLNEVAPRVYMEALKAAKGDLQKANERLQKRGSTLRDQTDRMESTKAIVKQLLKKSRDEKENVARAIYRDIGPVSIPVEEDIDEDDIDDDEEDIEPDPIDPNASQVLRGSYASCVTPTVEDHIYAIEGAIGYLFETDMYKIGKADKTRLRNILKKGLKALDG